MLEHKAMNELNLNKVEISTNVLLKIVFWVTGLLGVSCSCYRSAFLPCLQSKGHKHPKSLQAQTVYPRITYLALSTSSARAPNKNS